MSSTGNRYRETWREIPRNRQRHPETRECQRILSGQRILWTRNSSTFPHYAKNNATGVMKAGNSFTIEPMINAGTFHDDKWPYDWTAVTVHYLISSNSYFNKRDQNRPWFMDQIEQKY